MGRLSTMDLKAKAPDEWMISDSMRNLVGQIDPSAKVCRTEGGGLSIRFSRRIDCRQLRLGDRIASLFSAFPCTITMPSK